MSKYYQQDQEAVLKELNTDRENGLTEAVIPSLIGEYGKNEFEKEKPESIFRLILHQFTDASVIVLLFAGCISLWLEFREGGSFIEPIVIFSVIILNMVLSITQEKKSGRAIDALQELNAPTCMVLRDGRKQEINSEDLVPGDIILLESGSFIPADARLLESVSLLVGESPLTGESVPSEKDAQAVFSKKMPLGDQTNMVFSGCVVVAGRGAAVVTGTGMSTEMGKIAGLLNRSTRLKTPLQNRLDKISRLISFIAIGSAILLFGIGMLQEEEFWQMLMVSVSLAVAAVPETLSLIVTLSLSHGVQEMVKQNALIRKLDAVETLGSVSIICSDKTGTLTQNKMTIQRLWSEGEEPFKSTDSFDTSQMKFLDFFALASNASAELDVEGNQIVLGDPTESAIIHLFLDKDQNLAELEERYPRVHEIPFDSDRKLMTVIVKNPEGGYISLTKGAFDRIPLKETSEGSEIQEKRQEVHDSFATDALRVLALGYKILPELPEEIIPAELEKDLTFIGLVGMIDPPRPESKEAVAAARKAGIRTIMITGDHMETASAIAKEIGILTRGAGVMSGEELSTISEDELCEIVENYSVYARVSPEDKIRIVEAWQQNGEVVAMTGDGVNDAPALRNADVGISMGISGTDVAKSASDMILTDDNFATIIGAVRQGRFVFANIRKTVYFLLTCNFSEILMMIVAQLIGWGTMLTPVMLLFINIIGDGIPGLALAKEIPDERIMKRKPIGREESFFAGGMDWLIAKQALVFSVVSWIGFYIGRFIFISEAAPPSQELAQTLSFLIVGWTSVLHIFTVRSRKSIFKADYRSNPQLTISAIAMVIVFALLILIKPIGALLGLTTLAWQHWVAAIGLSIIPTIVAEIGKWREERIFRDRFKNMIFPKSVEDDMLDY